jgi:hypothetical protein
MVVSSLLNGRWKERRRPTLARAHTRELQFLFLCTVFAPHEATHFVASTETPMIFFELYVRRMAQINDDFGNDYLLTILLKMKRLAVHHFYRFHYRSFTASVYNCTSYQNTCSESTTATATCSTTTAGRAANAAAAATCNNSGALQSSVVQHAYVTSAVTTPPTVATVTPNGPSAPRLGVAAPPPPPLTGGVTVPVAGPCVTKPRHSAAHVTCRCHATNEHSIFCNVSNHGSEHLIDARFTSV